ncbi:MAG: hypothetical protein FWE20_06030 [Defluviitaleaceae bacterium]|nr:hypothetical protein [Defluviitaleaceae bacterium]
MKKAITKYIVSFLTVAALVVTPVTGTQLSGAELLVRFDALFAVAQTGVVHAPTSLQEYPYELDIIVIIEEDIIIVEEGDVYEESLYGDEHPESEYPEYEDHSEFNEEFVTVHVFDEPAPPAAMPVPSVEGFTVTSGINRRSESTFEAARTIVGTAPRGAIIRIEVYGYDESSDSFYMVSGTALTVGASGNFSSAQQLNLGRNFIRIKAMYHDAHSDTSFVSIETVQLNRLPDEVRNQLERGLLLP